MKNNIKYLLAAFIAASTIVTAQDIAAEIPQAVAECATCLPALLEKNWPAGITCLVTAIAAAVVRYFEKKKLLKKL